MEGLGDARGAQPAGAEAADVGFAVVDGIFVCAEGGEEGARLVGGGEAGEGVGSVGVLRGGGRGVGGAEGRVEEGVGLDAVSNSGGDVLCFFVHLGARGAVERRASFFYCCGILGEYWDDWGVLLRTLGVRAEGA